MKKKLIFGIVLVMFLNITSFTLASNTENSIDDEDYLIYSVAIQNSMKGFEIDKPFIFYGETMIDKQNITNLMKIIEQKDIIDNYVEVNNQSKRLENKFKVSWNIILINEHIEFPQNKSDNNISEIIYIYDKYKMEFNSLNGFIQLSRIGFSNDKKLALLYINFYHGPLFGNGDYYLLEKVNDKWNLKKKIRHWIS